MATLIRRSTPEHGLELLQNSKLLGIKGLGGCKHPCRPKPLRHFVKTPSDKLVELVVLQPAAHPSCLLPLACPLENVSTCKPCSKQRHGYFVVCLGFSWWLWYIKCCITRLDFYRQQFWLSLARRFECGWLSLTQTDPKSNADYEQSVSNHVAVSWICDVAHVFLYFFLTAGSYWALEFADTSPSNSAVNLNQNDTIYAASPSSWNCSSTWLACFHFFTRYGNLLTHETFAVHDSSFFLSCWKLH